MGSHRRPGKAVGSRRGALIRRRHRWAVLRRVSHPVSARWWWLEIQGLRVHDMLMVGVVALLEIGLGLALAVFFGDDVRIEVVKRAVALVAAGKRAQVLAHDLVVASAEAAATFGLRVRAGRGRRRHRVRVVWWWVQVQIVVVRDGGSQAN